MRLGDYRSSDNVEDQRGQSFGGGFGGGGGGLFGLLFGVVLSRFGIGGVLILLLGYCALSTFGGGGGSVGGGQPGALSPQQAQQAQQGGAAGSSATCSVDAASLFSCKVLAATEDTWARVFQGQGESYTPTSLVFYGGTGRSGCGMAQSAMGPFYCPSDQKIYLDTSFYDELSNRFGAAGDFAQAYVIAHEVGHHIQDLKGTLAEVQGQQQSLSSKQGNALQVRVELQADCLAGVWAANAKDRQGRSLLEPGDVEEGLRAASAIGDDTLQQQSQGRVVPDSFTHGSSAQRVQWLRKGLQSGDPSTCDTFAG